MTTEKWPAHGLEYVNKCLVCCSADRELLYEGLADRVFFCAPGEWTLYRCQQCGSAYLDPRPTLDTIGLAYSKYFTHNCGDHGNIQNLSWFRRIKRILANGYLNYRFGTKYHPASSLGILAALIFPSIRVVFESQGRNLSKHSQGRLLDVGCGNGSFLELAQQAGWEVVGVDPDPEAVAVACSRGLDVRQGDISVLDPSKEQFDGITMSHVIEHVHDPRTTLAFCYQLLKPGGWIWLETPNLSALGHMCFGASWRGLEPPRHLVLFTRSSLQYLLETAGFQKVEDQPYRPLCYGMFVSSKAIASGQDPYENKSRTLSIIDLWEIYNAECKAKKDVTVREFITMKAWKSK